MKILERKQSFGLVSGVMQEQRSYLLLTWVNLMNMNIVSSVSLCIPLDIH
jgi:hypothetical protein